MQEQAVAALNGVDYLDAPPPEIDYLCSNRLDQITN